MIYKRSFIYEEIIEFLLKRNSIKKNFLASEIVIPKRGKTIKNFIYKHSNINYKEIWTLYFIRLEKEKPIKFNLDLKQLRNYQDRFKLNLIKEKHF